jgi:hypothetical protein
MLGRSPARYHVTSGYFELPYKEKRFWGMDKFKTLDGFVTVLL